MEHEDHGVLAHQGDTSEATERTCTPIFFSADLKHMLFDEKILELNSVGLKIKIHQVIHRIRQEHPGGDRRGSGWKVCCDARRYGGSCGGRFSGSTPKTKFAGLANRESARNRVTAEARKGRLGGPRSRSRNQARAAPPLTPIDINLCVKHSTLLTGSTSYRLRPGAC